MNFVIDHTKTGFTFGLKKKGDEVICTSGEVYSSIENCKVGINMVLTDAPTAAIEDQTVKKFQFKKNPKFEIYLNKAGEFRFCLIAANGELIVVSEGFATKARCKKEIKNICKGVINAQIIESDKKQ